MYLKIYSNNLENCARQEVPVTQKHVDMQFLHVLHTLFFGIFTIADCNMLSLAKFKQMCHVSAVAVVWPVFHYLALISQELNQSCAVEVERRQPLSGGCC